MKHRLPVLGALLAATAAGAQDKIVLQLQNEVQKSAPFTTDSTRTWKRGGLYHLNFTQGTLNNWAAGGDDFSLAITTSLNLFSFYKSPRHAWDNTLDFSFGFVRSSSLGSRKNDDRLDFLSKYGFVMNPHLNLAMLFNFRSQLLRGYSYSGDERSLSSTFLSPAYVLSSVGLDYKPTKHLSIFVSPSTVRWVIVKDDTLSAKGLYGVAPGRHGSVEVGAFATVNYWKDLTTHLNYKGRLDLYSNYRHNPENVDVYFTNQFSVKLWKVLAATWNLDLIYDDDARVFGAEKNRPALQLKSLLGIGLQVKF
ncbi:DUF3078 domain-containing protein [Flaviaesturariibacter aridisoli]|uniref:DUF3078 domain-containing protein n=1 Tax=Flaviaesturariibacter aridisoli TaxID=2545761 RepID=A0A4R4E498_9BACT|nr:DUF3078 domain-containing protein [Flaviaesturariibacter aridisoli]TCZ71763.1 DUF3078 domain-containing protein [Flaviaesturariibacter aridisoli]